MTEAFSSDVIRTNPPLIFSKLIPMPKEHIIILCSTAPGEGKLSQSITLGGDSQDFFIVIFPGCCHVGFFLIYYQKKSNGMTGYLIAYFR